MRYWRVTAQTMLCGMDRIEVFEAETEEEAERIAARITDENASEWWDPDDVDFIDLDEDDWFAEVGYDLEEISKEEYDYEKEHY